MTSFAALLFNRPEPGTLGKSANNPREALILIGAIFFAALVATAWVLLLRKRRWHRRHRPHRNSAGVTPTTTANTGRPETVSSSTHTHRRRREKYTRRNPTLAETGGLPPKRAESDASAPQPQPQFKQPQTMRNE